MIVSRKFVVKKEQEVPAPFFVMVFYLKIVIESVPTFLAGIICL